MFGKEITKRTSKDMPVFMAQRHKAYKNILTFNWWVCCKANNPSTCYAQLNSLLLFFFLGIASYTICHSEQKSAVRRLFLCSFSLGFTVFKQLIKNVIKIPSYSPHWVHLWQTISISTPVTGQPPF